MNKKINLLIIASGLWVCACVEPFNLSIKSQLKILTVDATLNDLDEQQRIKITESVNYNNSIYVSSVLKANVELLINGTEKIPFSEEGSGVYTLPAHFRLKAGNTYQLFFSKADGTKYESTTEKLTTVPPISKISDEFKLKGIDKNTYFDAANYVYIDTQDPIADKNNYLWSWKLWERQSICISCTGGRYFVSPTATCRKESGLENATFDYQCKGNCWEIISNQDLAVFSDIYSNGQPITNKLVAKIPYYNEKGALIEVKQQSISAEAYRYLKLLADQIQNNGTLVDTPPAALVGNIKNTSTDNESVSGFFMVTSVQTIIHWIDRKEALSLNVKPVSLLGHTLNLEPSGIDISRPPMAPCILSKSRTPNKPNGWVN